MVNQPVYPLLVHSLNFVCLISSASSLPYNFKLSRIFNTIQWVEAHSPFLQLDKFSRVTFLDGSWTDAEELHKYLRAAQSRTDTADKVFSIPTYTREGEGSTWLTL